MKDWVSYNFFGKDRRKVNKLICPKGKRLGNKVEEKTKGWSILKIMLADRIREGWNVCGSRCGTGNRIIQLIGWRWTCDKREREAGTMRRHTHTHTNKRGGTEG